MNPEAEWIAEEVPHLRIIDDALWSRVKQRQGAIRDDILTERANTPDAPKIERGHRPRYLLSGLLTCGCCGAGYIMISNARYGCSAARNRGTCANKKTIARKDVETRVLNGLHTRLMHPELIREYIATWQQEMQRERTGDPGRPGRTGVSPGEGGQGNRRRGDGDHRRDVSTRA